MFLGNSLNVTIFHTRNPSVFDVRCSKFVENHAPEALEVVNVVLEGKLSVIPSAQEKTMRQMH